MLTLAIAAALAAGTTNHEPTVKQEVVGCYATPLACNLFMEARGEGIFGMAGVAFATINRKDYKVFSKKLTAIIKKDDAYSWTKGKTDWSISISSNEKNSWQIAKVVAQVVYNLSRHQKLYRYVDPTKGAIFYHAKHVSPDWATDEYKTASIGRHIFYLKDKNGWPTATSKIR